MSASEPPDGSGLIGEIVHDRYRIDSELGRGGMGAIYLAWDERLQRSAVIKIPRADLMNDPQLRQRFLAEIRDLSALPHPHIVPIEDSGEHRGTPFAVLRHLAGGDLSARLRACGGRMTVREILAWLEPIAEALDSIHAAHCVHRDVKPANILFDDLGNPFLSDFGISAAIDHIDSEAPTVAPQEQLTSAGTFVGSPAYAPPEAVDRILTSAYDQYSLATVVYLALSGDLPYTGATNEAILIAKASTPPRPLDVATLKERVPRKAGRVLMKALAKDPKDRYPSCSAFARAFATEAGGVEKRSGSRRGLAIAAGLAATLALVALVRTQGWLDSALEEGSADGLPSTVQLGSTPAEIDTAMDLCRRFSSHCERAEFETERAHAYRPARIALDRTEVTNEAFARFVAASGLVTRAERRGRSWDGPTQRSGLSWRTPSDGVSASDHPRWPVVHVTLDEARAFCADQGRRLPDADEWEWAARGAERRSFPWGDTWDDTRLRWSEDRGFGLEPVASHPSGATPDDAALHDMAGSVWEWTRTELDGEHVTKGASWDDKNPAYFRAAALSTAPADYTSSSLGFRCATTQ